MGTLVSASWFISNCYFSGIDECYINICLCGKNCVTIWKNVIIPGLLSALWAHGSVLLLHPGGQNQELWSNPTGSSAPREAALWVRKGFKITRHPGVKVSAQVELCACHSMHNFIMCIHMVLRVFVCVCVRADLSWGCEGCFGHGCRRAVLVGFGDRWKRKGWCQRGKKTETSLMKQVSDRFASSSTTYTPTYHKKVLAVYTDNTGV